MMRHGIRPPPPPALALPSESPAPPPATGGRRAGRLKRLAEARGGRGSGEPPGCAGGGSGPQRRWQACEAASATALRRPARRTPRLATKVEAGRAQPGSGARSLPAAPTCRRGRRGRGTESNVGGGAQPAGGPDMSRQGRLAMQYRAMPPRTAGGPDMLAAGRPAKQGAVAERKRGPSLRVRSVSCCPALAGAWQATRRLRDLGPSA